MAGNTRKLARMLADGLDPNLASNRKHGHVPLMSRAIAHGHRSVVALLEAAGAVFTWDDLRAAVKQGDGWSEEQERLFALLHPTGSPENRGLIHVAPDAATVRRVVGWGVAVDEHRQACPRFERRHTALALACQLGSLERASALLEVGANPNLMDRCSGELPLMVALAASGPGSPARRPRMYLRPGRAAAVVWVDLLLAAGADATACDSKGESVLSHAAWMGCPHAVRRLIAAGASAQTPADDPEKPFGRLTRKRPPSPLERVLWCAPPEGAQEQKASLDIIQQLLSAGASWDAPPSMESSRKKWASIREWMHEEEPAWAALLTQASLKIALPQKAPGEAVGARPKARM